MADASQKGKAGSGRGLEETEDPQGAIDSQAKHYHPANQAACYGGPEPEKLDHRPDFRF